MIEDHHSEQTPSGSPSLSPSDSPELVAAPAYPNHPHLTMPGGISPPQALVLFGIRWGKPSAIATRVLLIAGVMLSYSLFFILQEAIFKKEKCEYAGFVSLVHFCMFWIFGMLERITTKDPIPRSAFYFSRKHQLFLEEVLCCITLKLLSIVLLGSRYQLTHFNY